MQLSKWRHEFQKVCFIGVLVKVGVHCEHSFPQKYFGFYSGRVTLKVT